jgi:hypothetical protein
LQQSRRFLAATERGQALRRPRRNVGRSSIVVPMRRPLARE